MSKDKSEPKAPEFTDEQIDKIGESIIAGNKEEVIEAPGAKEQREAHAKWAQEMEAEHGHAKTVMVISTLTNAMDYSVPAMMGEGGVAKKIGSVIVFGGANIKAKTGGTIVTHGFKEAVGTTMKKEQFMQILGNPVAFMQYTAGNIAFESSKIDKSAIDEAVKGMTAGDGSMLLDEKTLKEQTKGTMDDMSTTENVEVY